MERNRLAETIQINYEWTRMDTNRENSKRGILQNGSAHQVMSATGRVQRAK